MQSSLTARALVEAIGVFALCFIGILAIGNGGILGQPDGINDLTGVALAHGCVIAVMVAAFGHVSGGHFNPAVTFALLLAGRINLKEALVYVLAQLLGGMLAAFALLYMFDAELVAGGTPQLGAGMTVLNAIVLEAIATFFLVAVIIGVAVDERSPKYLAPLAIGLAVLLDILAIGPLTGAAMNPARVFGPALATSGWENHMVYWVGPLLGGALAAFVMETFILPGKRPQQSLLNAPRT